MSEPFFHLDLFSGIGGFSLAAQTVWGSDYHCVGFCEIDSFCQQVLRKNFKGVRIYGDIRGLTRERLLGDIRLTSNAESGESGEQTEQEGGQDSGRGNLTAERLARDAESSAEQSVGTICQGADSDSAGSVGEVGERDERLAADTASDGLEEQGLRYVDKQFAEQVEGNGTLRIDLLTGGFPCQPFSTAGKRKGTEDDRFLWPEMLRVIREVKPRWVIGENVDGLLSMVEFESDLELDDRQYREEEKAMGSSGVGEVRERRGRGVLDEALADLEGSGYDVQVFTIPACSLNAPHRRDRVWIIAHRQGGSIEDSECGGDGRGYDGTERGGERALQIARPDCRPSSDTCGEGLEGCEETRDAGSSRETSKQRLGEFPESRTFPDWSRDWREVAFESCVRGMDDGIPRRVVRFSDGTTISESRWRQNALKAYGNSIVPQVAMEIMRAIKAIDHE